MGGEMFADYLPGGEGRELPSAIVRLATAGDVDGCARLAAGRNGGDVSEWSSRLLGHVQAENGAMLVVAVVDDVVGYGRVAWFSAPGGLAKVAPTGYYLMGLLIDPRWRRTGLGRRLTAARLAWVWQRAAECWFFANAGNRASLDLHSTLGFHEVTRDFWFPGVTFDGGEGVLGRAERPGDIAFR